MASLIVISLSRPPHPVRGAPPFVSNGERAPSLFVRMIFGISCLLLGAAMLSCQVESSGEVAIAKPQAAVRWVRTVDGWERPASWNLEPVTQRSLHPLVVAAGQGLLSVLGLVAFQRNKS